MTYQEWIAANVKGDGYGQCAEVTAAMAQAFPELTRVRGHYLDAWWGERAHWWCIAPDGTVVDPTAAQFPTAGAGVYLPWDEGAEEPSGKCIECGAYVYGGGSVCSDACGDAQIRYLMGGM